MLPQRQHTWEYGQLINRKSVWMQWIDDKNKNTQSLWAAMWSIKWQKYIATRIRDSTDIIMKYLVLIAYQRLYIVNWNTCQILKLFTVYVVRHSILINQKIYHVTTKLAYIIMSYIRKHNTHGLWRHHIKLYLTLKWRTMRIYLSSR